MKSIFFALFLVLSTSLALADSFRTEEYNQAGDLLAAYETYDAPDSSVRTRHFDVDTGAEIGDGPATAKESKTLAGNKAAKASIAKRNNAITALQGTPNGQVILDALRDLGVIE